MLESPLLMPDPEPDEVNEYHEVEWVAVEQQAEAFLYENNLKMNEKEGEFKFKYYQMIALEPVNRLKNLQNCCKFVLFIVDIFAN